jgi:hypothetical protein
MSVDGSNWDARTMRPDDDENTPPDDGSNPDARTKVPTHTHKTTTHERGTIVIGFFWGVGARTTIDTHKGRFKVVCARRDTQRFTKCQITSVS